MYSACGHFVATDMLGWYQRLRRLRNALLSGLCMWPNVQALGS